MVAVNAAIFCLFSASFYMVAPQTTAVFSYPAFAAAAFISFYRAMKDAARALARHHAHP